MRHVLGRTIEGGASGATSRSEQFFRNLPMAFYETEFGFNYSHLLAALSEMV
jgi:hypothetical protein